MSDCSRELALLDPLPAGITQNEISGNIVRNIEYIPGHSETCI